MQLKSARWPKRLGVAAIVAALSFAGAGPALAASGTTVSPAEATTQQSIIVNPDIGRGAGTVVSSAGFAHPGIVDSRDELDLMRDMVQKGIEPWKSAYESVRRDPRASSDYQLQGPLAVVKGSNLPMEYTIGTDGFAAHDNALEWYVTGNQAYANKALDIIRQWSSTLTSLTEFIHAAPGVARMASAAEILRYTPGSGWTDNDTASFSHLLRIVASPPPVGIDRDDMFQNQAGYGHTALFAAAVFLDDRELYAKYLNRATVGTNPVPGQDFSLDRQINDNGQVNEMGRDEPHAHGDLTTLAEIAQTTSIQAHLGKLGDLGVDLFTYRNNRLLSGAEFFAKYNLGYDVPWTPHVLNPTTTYTQISSTTRGEFTGKLSEANVNSPLKALIYNHYHYDLGVPDSSMPHLTSMASQIGDDWNDLLWTPAAAAQSTKGSGPPVVEGSYAPDPSFERVSAADWTTSSGKTTVRNDPWVDANGSRLIIRDIQAGGWVSYKDFDFGDVPRDTFLLRGGASTTVPTQVAIHLDSPAGELIGNATIAPTGWYTIFQTTATKLVRPFTGKHTIVLVFTGSNNVYHWQGSVDWIKVAAGSAQLETKAASAPISSGTQSESDGTITLARGASIGWRDLDFDNGSLSFNAQVRTEGVATLELRTGSPDGPTVATYALPDTAGQLQTIQRPQDPRAIVGRHDVYLVQTGGAALTLGSIRWSEGVDPYAATSATSPMGTPVGQSKLTAGGDALTVSADSTIALPLVEFKSGANTLGVRYRSPKPVTLTVYSDRLDSTPIASGVLPAAPDSRYRTARLTLTPSPTRAHMLFVKTDANVDLQSLQADPVNAAPPVVSVDLPSSEVTGSTVSIPISAYDPDGHSVSISAESLPKGAVLKHDAVVWTPSQAGTVSLVLVADDGHDITRSVTQVQVG
ncbi:MAG: carbohydrate-binding protein [Leifsonia sp.]